MMRKIIALLLAVGVGVVLTIHFSRARAQVVLAPGGDPIAPSSPSSVSPITLTPLATIPASPSAKDPVKQLTAIDYQEVNDTVLVSVNAPSGEPYNFEQVTRSGVHTQFSNNTDFPEEVHIAIAPSQNCSGRGLSLGGFTVGDVFVGSGFGVVSRISADGSTTQTPFATLPGETGLLWGGLAFDRTGAFNGDLIASTTSGGVYRINSAGVATLVAKIPGIGVKGVVVIPNDPRFGPIAGKILVGGTPLIETSPAPPDNGFVIDAGGSFSTLDLGIHEPEGFRIVPPSGDFFATDVPTHTVFTAPASQFAGIVGDLVIAGEIDFNTHTGRLFDVVYSPGDPNARPNGFVVTEIPGGRIGQYEGITFSCGPCVPATLTCPPNVCVASASGGPAPVTYPTPATSSGTLATCTPPSGSVFVLGTTPVTCTAGDGCGGTATCGFNVTLSLFSLTMTDFAGSGSFLTINVTTGAYVFTCGDGTTMSGTAILTIKGGIIVLEDDMGGRCVLAKIDLLAGRGVATLESPMGVVRCQINGRLTPACGQAQ